MSASVTSSSNASNAYFPVTISTANQYLKVDRNNSSNSPHSSTDFCLQFDYVASHVKLLVSDSSPRVNNASSGSDDDRNVIEFGHNQESGHWFRKQLVCAAQLSERPEGVEALYFSFEAFSSHENAPKNFNIEGHMVANLQYITE